MLLTNDFEKIHKFYACYTNKLSFFSFGTVPKRKQKPKVWIKQAEIMLNKVICGKISD